MSGLDEPLARAAGFVAIRGGALDRLYLETLLRERPADALLAALAGGQAAGGALPAWRGAARTDPASTAQALARLDALGLLDHPVVERAAGYLLAGQREDGSFGDAADAAARVPATGELTGLLAKTPFARPSALSAAERFLAASWSVERVQGGDYAAILGYFHLLANWPSALADEALQWCGRELERGYRTGAFDALDAARVFLWARGRALPGAQISCDELVAGILALQSDDGGWPAPADGGDRVDAALDAIEALLRLGQPAT